MPFYILKYNMSTTNPITYKVTALGRVLFYDKKLSVDNSISCASCRKQELALDDTAHISLGVNWTIQEIFFRFALEDKLFCTKVQVA